MDERNYNRLVAMIRLYSFGIGVQESLAERTFLVCKNGHYSFRSMPCLILRRRSSASSKGFELDRIPVADIDKAVDTLSMGDASFDERIKGGDMTMEDVERIIHKASYGMVSLHLSARRLQW